ncbi:MAG: LPS export ABC transporter periplasmic protein LptC [Candidatus Riflebacteria bacterium]|nr:LPS export ABC transporter periplasmic protein LptC [Candidatus Riflebacteria bacterium]
MKAIFSNIWFWLAVLLIFLGIIFKESDIDKETGTKYYKEKMRLKDVHFSEMDKGFEHLRVFADELEMDESQNNMFASKVRALFFDKNCATKTANLVASFAEKNPFEIRFYGDVRITTSDNERLRTDELRYFSSRKDLYSTCTVTIWKDNTVITGRELRYNTQRREGILSKDVLIRIWKPVATSPEKIAVASPSENVPLSTDSKKLSASASSSLPRISDLIIASDESETASETTIASKTAIASDSKKAALSTIASETVFTEETAPIHKLQIKNENIASSTFFNPTRRDKVKIKVKRPGISQ